jgi:hypothetical protein
MARPTWRTPNGSVCVCGETMRPGDGRCGLCGPWWCGCSQPIVARLMFGIGTFCGRCGRGFKP